MRSRLCKKSVATVAWHSQSLARELCLSYARSGANGSPLMWVNHPLLWRARGKIISSVLCSIVCNNCTQWTAHTHMNDLSVLWIGFCLTGPISLCLDSFLCMYCFVSDCTLHACVLCSIVIWWGGPGGTEAWSLWPLLPSVLWQCWLGHLTHKTRPWYDL